MTTPVHGNGSFVLIDDEEDSKIVPLISRLTNENPVLKIRRGDLFGRGSEASLDAQSALVDSLARPSAEREYGVILDLRLDGSIQSNGKAFPAFGTTVAQEIRTRETFRGGDWCFPLVLLSMEAVFSKGYQRDRTGRDLFDLATKKERLLDSAAAREFGSQLISLAQGYAQIREWSGGDFVSVLGALPLGAYIGPDIRRELADGTRPRHDLAQFLIRGLIETPGILIDQHYLCARLGFDLQDSGVHGEKLVSMMSEFSYRGVFSSGWPRWWWGAIEKWWSANFPRERALRMLTADHRVRLLSEKFHLDHLKPALPITDGYGSRYWVACAVTNKPLDPLDAVKIDGPVPAPWQESRHIHLQAAVDSTEIPEGVRIHPSEEARIERLRHADESEAERKW